MSSSITGSKNASRSWFGPLLALAVAGLLLGLPLTIAADGPKNHAKVNSAPKGSHRQPSGKGHKGKKPKGQNGKPPQTKRQGPKRHDAQVHLAKQYRVVRLHAWHKSWPVGWHSYFWWHGHFCWHGHSLWRRNYWWTTIVRPALVVPTVAVATVIVPTVTVTPSDGLKTFSVTYRRSDNHKRHTHLIRAASAEEAKEKLAKGVHDPNPQFLRVEEVK